MTTADTCRMLLLCMLLAFPTLALGQDASLVELQKSEIKSLSMMDGAWRGDAWIILPNGSRQEMTQTERVGPLLDGAVKLVEGRGYDSSGNTVFNAFGVIAYDAQKRELTMRSYAQGRMGDFSLQVAEDGFSWEIPAGPAKIRYTAKITNEEWFEYGERVVGDGEPFRFFEMKLKRIADSDWPATEAVAPK